MVETWGNLVSVETEKLDEALAVSALPEIWICPLSLVHSFPFNAWSHFFCFPIMVQYLKKVCQYPYLLKRRIRRLQPLLRTGQTLFKSRQPKPHHLQAKHSACLISPITWQTVHHMTKIRFNEIIMLPHKFYFSKKISVWLAWIQLQSNLIRLYLIKSHVLEFDAEFKAIKSLKMSWVNEKNV